MYLLKTAKVSISISFADGCNMNKTTDFINKHSVQEIIKYIEVNKVNIEKVICKSKDARKEFGLKVQKLIEHYEQK